MYKVVNFTVEILMGMVILKGLVEKSESVTENSYIGKMRNSMRHQIEQAWLKEDDG